MGGTRGDGKSPKDLLSYIDGIENIVVVRAQGSGGASQGGEGASSLFRIYPKAGADPRGDIAKVIATANDMELLQLTPERASLEEVFRKLTQGVRPDPATAGGAPASENA